MAIEPKYRVLAEAVSMSQNIAPELIKESVQTIEDIHPHDKYAWNQAIEAAIATVPEEEKPKTIESLNKLKKTV